VPAVAVAALRLLMGARQLRRHGRARHGLLDGEGGGGAGRARQLGLENLGGGGGQWWAEGGKQ
jgi:hypothetical protein